MPRKIPLVAFFGLTLSAATVLAEDRIVELWHCKPKQDASAEEIQSRNHNWLQFVNSRIKGGGVRSFVLSSVVGPLEGFVFADSYPSMEAWVAAKAALKTPEGKSVDGALNEVVECASNSLAEMQES